MLSPLTFGCEVLPANTLNGELTRHHSTVKSWRSLSTGGTKAGWAHRERHQMVPGL